MLLAQNKSLAPLTSLKVGGSADYFTLLSHESELPELIKFSKSSNLPLIIIGAGTNTFFSDKNIKGLVIKIDIRGIRTRQEFDDSAHIEIGAGENWDKVVEWTVKRKLSGLEALSAIPGTAGSAPVQNIGAYGTELSDVFVRLTAYDIQKGEFVTLSLNDCQFSYRNSIFKKEPGRYIIARIVLEVSRKMPEIPDYKGVEKYFSNTDRRPSVRQIRNAIIEIRKEKLPDPSIIPNAGSFFKNPILSKTSAEKIFKEFPNIPHFETNDGQIKIYAGWLIEQCGFKGKYFGNVGIYEKNALVITTNGRASADEILSIQKNIIQTVNKKFGIELEMEVNYIK